MFHKLALETITEILLNLDAFDLIRAQLVCRRCFRTITTDPALQYRIELYAANMKDNPDVQMCLSDRLSALKERSNKRLALAKDNAPPFVNDRQFLHPWGFDPLQWFFSNGILIVQDEESEGPTEKYIVRDLRVEGKGEKEWQYGRPGESYGEPHNVLIDVLQDLLVTVNEEDGMGNPIYLPVDFISLRLGTPHPEAFKPTMELKLSTFSDINPTITAHGRYIVVLERRSSTSQTRIINWKTGEEKIIKGPYFAYKVLNEDFILLCSYVSTNECPISLSVVSLNGAYTSPLLTLNYPAFDGFSASHFRPEFISGGPPDDQSCSRLSSRPFYPSPEDSIILLDLKRATGYSNILWNYASLFRVSDILRHLPALGDNDNVAHKLVTLQWGEWRETNFDEICGKNSQLLLWDAAAAGSHFAALIKDHLFLFDFERRLAFDRNINVPDGAKEINLGPEQVEEEKKGRMGRVPEQKDGKNKKGKNKKKPHAKMVPWEGVQRPPPMPCYMYKMELPEGIECYEVRQFSMDATHLVVARNPLDDIDRNLLHVYKWE